MTKKSILETPKLVLLMGSWYLLTGALAAFSFLSSMLMMLLVPALRQMVPLHLTVLGGVFVALKLWGAWRYIRLDSRGWLVLLVLEAWGVLRQVVYFTAYGFGLPVPGDAGAAAVFGLIQFLAVVFMLSKLAVLLHTKRCFEEGFGETVLDIKKDILGWG